MQKVKERSVDTRQSAEYPHLSYQTCYKKMMSQIRCNNNLSFTVLYVILQLCRKNLIIESATSNNFIEVVLFETVLQHNLEF